MTFTAVVEGCEWRLGVDRDQDGHRDGDELDAGSDPGDPNSIPTSTGVGTRAPTVVQSSLWLTGPNPTDTRSQFGFEVRETGRIRLDVYDVRGRHVRRLMDDAQRQPGVYDARWDLRDARGHRVSSGVYFVKLHMLDGIDVKRVTVVR